MSFQIILSQTEWDSFVHALNHRDKTVNELANSFLTSIRQELSVHCEADKIYVSSPNINEEDIINALLEKGNCK